MLFTLPPIYISVNKLTVRLLTICLSVCFLQSMAQKLTLPPTVNSINKHSSSPTNSGLSYNQEKLVTLAKINRWPLIKNYANNKILTLHSIDIFGEPVYYTTHNILALTGTKTAALQSGGALGLALTGSLPALSGRIAIWDGGNVRTSHVELNARIKNQENTTDIFNDHATHLVGTMAAIGKNSAAKGMAPEASVNVWDYTDDIAEMNAAAANLLISNHAYGPILGWIYNPTRPGKDNNLKWEWWGNTSVSTNEDFRFGYYDDKAREWDRMAYNNPNYLIVKSADNKRIENGPPDGFAYFLKDTDLTSTAARYRNNAYDIMPAEATAKNILTVGAADMNVTNGRVEDFSVANFSGWGPTDDGRIKPDLLGVGKGIVSPIALTDNTYATYSGTSSASANVSGALLLLQELFYKNNSYFMRSATLKGLAIHTAQKPTNDLAPNYEYGWGLLDTEKAAKCIINKEKSEYLSEKTLAQNGTYSQKFVASGNGPLTVTICWTDPEALVTTISSKTVDDNSSKLINDLDLRVNNGADVYMPWILDPANPQKIATKGDNFRDNVEQIIIEKPNAGDVYTVMIGHKRKLKNESQHYTIIVSGLMPQDCNAAVKIITGSDTTLCGNAKMPLNIKGGAGFDYEWLKNGEIMAITTQPQVMIDQEGLYAVRAVGYQCTGTSTNVRVRVLNLTSNITPSSTITVCASSPVTLSSTTTGNRYQWFYNGKEIENANNTTLAVSEAGQYSLATSSDACTAISKTTRVLAMANRPIVSTNTGIDIPQGGSIRLTTQSAEDTQYQWYWNDEAIRTATGPRLTASKAGHYSVRIAQNGCVLYSKSLKLQLLYGTKADNSIKSTIWGQSLKLYPNPARESLYVTYDSEDSYNLEASIVSLDGITFRKAPLNDNGIVFYSIFDLTNLPSGSYLIRVSDGVRSVSKIFVKY
jgi:Subtilase family/Secretion system C-terminal sorting domain